MKKIALGTALVLAQLAMPAFAAGLPTGTLITGSASGATDGLLGLDHLFVDEPGSNITALVDNDLEYLTRDYAVMVDFFKNGNIVFSNNLDNSLTLAGSYTLSFSFAGLSQKIESFTLSDVSGVSGGTITPLVLSDNSISITLQEVSVSSRYGGFTAQVNLASPVPEPATALLTLAGLGLLALRRRSQA